MKKEKAKSHKVNFGVRRKGKAQKRKNKHDKK